jgi:hemoglobin
MSDSLYSQLGGAPAISAALDDFYPRVLGDPLLAPYFEGVDMSRLKGMAEAFLAMAFGGPNGYSGAGLRAVHARPRRQGMGDAEFDRFMDHFGATLHALNVPEPKIAEVAAIALAARDDVLGR